MQYAQIVAAVQERAALATVAEADRVTRSTLTLLEQRLAACPGPTLRLPRPLAAETTGDGEDLAECGIEEFYSRIATHAGTAPAVARERARAVVAVLRDTLAAEDFVAVFEQLPAAYVDLLGVKTGTGLGR